jgi:polyisoprenyl-phosphate glycosyltransferase
VWAGRHCAGRARNRNASSRFWHYEPAPTEIRSAPMGTPSPSIVPDSAPTVTVNDERRLVICIPVFNDWTSVFSLLERIDVVAQRLRLPVSVLLVDDGSSELPPNCKPILSPVIQSIEVLQLRRNLGHQRAIALGLTFIHATHPSQFVVVMDADGEDIPDDIEALINCCRENACRKLIFAKRAKRSEGQTFRLGYAAYRIIHLILTGHRVEVGNFSVIPSHMLDQLVAVSELWNHYAAAVFHSRLPVTTLPLARGHRLAGQSKMNLISLITHGMSAISVYCDTVGVRLMCVTAVLILFVLGGLLIAIGIRVFTTLAIPGWATTAVGILAVVLLNLFTLLMVFVLFVLQSRSMSGFLPIRDWQYFVARHWNLNG